MNKYFMFILLVFAGVWYGCTEADIPEGEISIPTSKNETTDSEISEIPMLEFESLEDFQNALKIVSSYNTDEDKLQWVKNKFPNLISIQSLYWDAMGEMALINGEDENECLDFKTKYSHLYFPNYLEDGGFYIPMTDLDAAFLVNTNCEVSIAGKVTNMRDINTYEDLMESGRAYYSIVTPLTRGSLTQVIIREPNMNSLGPEYDSGWKVNNDNDRKAKLKARRVLKEDNSVVYAKRSMSLLHLEFCFRKKTWLGWSNYSSKSTLDFTANIPGRSTPLRVSFSNSGTSSHDMEFAYPIAIQQDNAYWYFTYVETPCVANVEYQGMGSLKYQWNMPGIQYKAPLSESTIDIFPRL